MKHFLLVISILLMGTTSFGKMLVKYQWKYLDLLWENPQQKQEAINSGAYNISVSYVYDIDRAPDGRTFITAVRDKGVPVGLMTVTDQQGEGGPLLRPYPDWTWYKDDCKGITGGVYQVDIKCNHLFVVDSGRLGDDQLCPPQLLIFDLSTDKLVKRVNVPNEIIRNGTRFGLISSAFVYAPDCKDVKNNAIAFVADTKSFGLMIYNARTSKICRTESDFMKISNFSFMFENKNYSFEGITIGTYGLTIIGKELYYTNFMGNKIYKMEYSKLMECSEKNMNEANQKTKLVSTLESPTTMVTSDRCAIFFNDLTKTSIMCADATKEINSKNKDVIAHDPIQLQFPSGMKVRNGELWVLSNRYHIHSGNYVNIPNSLNKKEINFRVLSMPIKEIQKNTNCYSSCNY